MFETSGGLFMMPPANPQLRHFKVFLRNKQQQHSVFLFPLFQNKLPSFFANPLRMIYGPCEQRKLWMHRNEKKYQGKVYVKLSSFMFRRALDGARDAGGRNIECDR